jgi:molybdopterin converting factor small subunit
MTPDPSYRIQLSGDLAIQAGRSRLDLVVPGSADELAASEIKARVSDELPDLAPLVRKSLVVAGDRIVGSAEVIPAGTRLSLVPPVSGG